MTPPTDPSSADALDRSRALFHRAQALPEEERETFVRREAGADAALREQALELLLSSSRDRASSAARSERERVQSTATEELLAKLASAPKLDAERFVVEGEVGKGGMGAVYRVHDRHLNRRLAMKLLLEQGAPRSAEEEALAHQMLGRFLEEAQVSSQLDHPGVVPVHELGLDQGGKVWFTMRLVKGRTASGVFADAFAGREGWTLTQALEVVLKVCDTMAYAHSKGVLHRDLKPSNVMVGKFGEVYVMDWGLAKVVGQPDRNDLRIRPEAAVEISRLDTARRRDAEAELGSSVVTMDGTTLGTPSYMSPEQALGQMLDARADVYSIGAMLYELVAGTAPYTTPGARKPAYRILDDVLALPPRPIEELRSGVPPELVAIIGKAMARAREQRYADTAALAADLRAFLGHQVVSAYRTGALIELRLWIKRNRPLAASLASAVLILLLGILGTTWLARENAELAEAETSAKEDAQRTAAQLAATVRNFHQLSADVLYRRALANEQELWPATQEKIAALERWLREDCGKLLAMEPEIRRAIEELRAQTLPFTEEEAAADRRSHPRAAELELVTKHLAALRTAQALREGRSLIVPELSPQQRALDAQDLDALAWSRVTPTLRDRTVWGEEALALAAARAAVAKTESAAERASYLDTLAWALLANGQDEDAREKSAEALAAAPEEEQQTYTAHARAIAAAIESSSAQLRDVEARHAELESLVRERRTWTFPATADGEAARFLHETLTALVLRLEALARQQKLEVERRLRWAREVGAISRAHPLARVTWAGVRAAIAKADDVVASARYAGRSIDLADDAMNGLVPIGMNPRTKLWEFYELRSAWDGEQPLGEIPIPVHREDGSIEMQGETGIVFVLLPGGTVTLGSQDEDREAPYYDERRRDDERLRQVSLVPFFLARHELTQAQWSRLCTWDAELRAPSGFKAGQMASGRKIERWNPVEQVDWTQCELVLGRHGLVLPTEAQWEYACRAETTTPWSVPFDELHTAANVADTDAERAAPQWGLFEAWADGQVVHAPVGSFAANAFGLHDLHGNVAEWCRDQRGSYGGERSGDGLRPEGADRSRNRVFRGGSFIGPAAYARSAYGSGYVPTFRNDDLGLRAARSLTR
ncbi:MAG: SUMF1/EgtB/PvdO family nonheme iron enzyme [Planctomycetes bacterium]|nr:SUMF1/EgtB/PvdO family nonheme iron enzyme [Planctomycetota bacterium]